MYFFSFIYNMLKCQKEEKGFCKTQKYELQLLPAACCSQKKRARTFPGVLAQTPSAISRCLRATSFPPLSSIFLLLFHFLYPAYFSFFAGNLHTQPATHPVRFLPAARTLRFHYFFVSKRSHSFASRHAFFRRQPAASYPHHSYPSTSQNFAFRIAGHTLPVPFSFKAFLAFH